jgi:hypothetical protein
MIYLRFVAAVVYLLLPSAQALPASYEHTFQVSLASREDPNAVLGKSCVLNQCYNGLPSRFAKNSINGQRNSPRNLPFPPIFYLPQRRDTARDRSERRATNVILLSNQNGIPPPHTPTSAAQNATAAISNTSITLIPRPTPAGGVHRMVAKNGASAIQKKKTLKTVTSRKEGKGKSMRHGVRNSD